MKLRKTLVGAAAAACSTVMLLATPASAAATASHTQTQYLAEWAPVGSASCVQLRTIYLAAGNYDWRQVLPASASSAPADRFIYLAAGNYSWSDCVEVTQDGTYDQWSQLTRDSTGGYATIDRSYGLLSSGTFTWGSQLDPQF